MASPVSDGAQWPRMNGPFPAENNLFVFQRNFELNEPLLDLRLDLCVVPGLPGPMIDLSYLFIKIIY